MSVNTSTNEWENNNNNNPEHKFKEIKLSECELVKMWGWINENRSTNQWKCECELMKIWVRINENVLTYWAITLLRSFMALHSVLHTPSNKHSIIYEGRKLKQAFKSFGASWLSLVSWVIPPTSIQSFTRGAFNQSQAIFRLLIMRKNFKNPNFVFCDSWNFGFQFSAEISQN